MYSQSAPQRFGNFGTYEPQSVDTIYLNAIPNVKAPTKRTYHDFCPAPLREMCPGMLEMLRVVLYNGAAATPQGYPSPFIYFMNVYAAGDWNNQFFESLSSMYMSVVTYLYETSQVELDVARIAGDVVQAHILKIFSADVESWVRDNFHNEYNALRQGGPYLQWAESEVKGYMAQRLAPQQAAAPYNPYGKPQAVDNGYRPNAGSMREQARAPQSSYPTGGQPAQAHAATPYQIRDSASQLNGNPLDSLPSATKNKQFNQPTTQQAQPIQRQPVAEPDSAWGPGDFDKDITVLAVEGNFGGYSPSLVVSPVSWEEYLKEHEAINAALVSKADKTRRLLLPIEEESAAIERIITEAYTTLRVLGHRYMSGLYCGQGKPVGTNQRFNGTKNLTEMIETVFGARSDEIIDYSLCKAVVLDNRETLLFPSTHSPVRKCIDAWRMDRPYTHNTNPNYSASEDHFYRLIQYPGIETVFVEDVYVMSEEIMSKNELFSTDLHLPAHLVKPSPTVAARNAAILQQTPPPVILDTEEHESDDLNVIVNQTAVVATTAQNAISAAHAVDVLSGEAQSIEQSWSDNAISVVRYNTPSWFMFSCDEDRAWFNSRCTEMLDGTLTQIDTLHGRLRSAGRQRLISKPFYDFLNKYLGKKLSTLVNHELCFRTAIFEEGFVEEWEWVKQNVLTSNTLPGFVKTAWTQNESIWLTSAFTALSPERQGQYSYVNAYQIDNYLPFIGAQIPMLKCMDSNTLLSPTNERARVEDFLLATWAQKDASELAALTDEERDALEEQYHASQESEAEYNLRAVDLDISELAILVDQYCVYQVPFNHDELGLEPTYLENTVRAVSHARTVSSPALNQLVNLLNEHAELELSARIQQQLFTRDGYVVDVVRSVCNRKAFTFVLRDA